MNFVALNDKLGGIVEQMTPPSVRASAKDLHAHFAARHEAAYERMVSLREQTDKVHSVAAVAAVGGSIAALGMLAASTAPVTIPLANAVWMGSLAVAAARLLVHQARSFLTEEELDRTRYMVSEASHDEMAAGYARDAEGGLLTRLYRRTRDLVAGHERRAEAIVAQMSSTGFSGPEHVKAVKQILRGAATPAFVTYVQRNAVAPHTAAARLMARLSELPDVNLAALAPTGLIGKPGMPRVGTTLGGFAPAGRASSLLADLGRTTAPTTHYGYIAASESERSFLQSLGVELGVYNDNEGRFPAKVDPAALRQLEEHRDTFPAELYAFQDSRVDSRTLLLDINLDQALPETLSGYRAFLRYTVGTELGGMRAASVLSDVNREMHQRAARLRAAPTAVPAVQTAPGLAM
ncbi:hypothetical protein [Cupriavidus pampae]|uniref:DUF4231 domain-containing protein n=1 Tax=Cupriavidus pampae TaxID=659251 RepID=A0ABN7ZIN4_9BURK|nr:hypothetical protein [Cupriavidus pampae]CAG9184135.1 hypothetical protein LMG32289_05527 [Cupriavidus pampae]